MKETQILSYYNALSDYYTNTSGIIDSIRLNSARNNTLKIKKVILNDPATIVYWDDRTKTVVKVDHEKYDPEKLKDGWNIVDGEEIYYISNPALGLWVFDKE